MVNESEKLDKFKKAIFADASAQADKIISAAQQESGERIAQAEIEAESWLKAEKEQTDREYAAAAVREVSSGSLESQRNVLLSRERIIDKVFANVREELAEFMKTPEYAKMLTGKVRECADAYPDEKGVVYVSYNDEGLSAQLSLGGRFEVRVSDTIEIGGVMVVFEESNLAVDCTLDSAFMQQREGFAGKAGLVL